MRAVRRVRSARVPRLRALLCDELVCPAALREDPAAGLACAVLPVAAFFALELDALLEGVAASFDPCPITGPADISTASSPATHHDTRQAGRFSVIVALMLTL